MRGVRDGRAPGKHGGGVRGRAGLRVRLDAVRGSGTDSILLLAGTEATAGRGVALLAAYAAGIGIPFLAAALFTGSFLRAVARFRAHLPIIEKATGLVLVGTGLLVLMGAMPVIGGWLLEYAPILGRIG